MSISLHVSGDKGAYWLMERQWDGYDRPDYTRHCPLSDAEALSLVSSGLVVPWDNDADFPADARETSNPALHLGLVKDNGSPAVRLELGESITPKRSRAVRVYIPGLENVLWKTRSHEGRTAFLARTRIADGRATAAPPFEDAVALAAALAMASEPSRALDRRIGEAIDAEMSGHGDAVGLSYPHYTAETDVARKLAPPLWRLDEACEDEDGRFTVALRSPGGTRVEGSGGGLALALASAAMAARATASALLLSA